MDEARTSRSPGGFPIETSPRNQQVRSSCSMPRKIHNRQAAAAAQRLARVMAHHSGDEQDNEGDDVSIECNTTGLGLSAGRARRPRPSMPARQPMEVPSPMSQSCVIRPSLAQSTNELQSARSSTPVTSPSHTFVSVGRTPASASSVEQIQHSQHTRMLSRGLPIVGIKTVNKIASSTSVSRKQQSLGCMSLKQNSSATESRDTSALQDEVDMLQEENDHLVEKLRLIEYRCEEAEARAKQLQTQVSTLGGGASLESRLLNRKNTALKKETVKEVSATALEQLQECESELRTLQSTIQRLVLTPEEMEEVVLKRCWLSRHWSLCVHYGIHPDIAREKHKYWSSCAPAPLQVVLSVGRKSKDGHQVNSDSDNRENIVRDVNQICGEHNAERMLLVEKGLRALASLKVEDAILLEMGLRRKQYVQRSSFSDETRLPTELHKFGDPCELSPDEVEDVQFKLAWLTYFWRRAKSHGLVDEIAEERLETWINQSSHQHNSHDAVDVERGMMELRKLGIDTILWEESRRYVENDASPQRSEA